jgi:hypothetical protein
MDDPDNSSFPEELPDAPFDAFQTIGEIVAYVWHKEGEGALRELMARPIPGHPYTREDLLDTAAELRSAGLGQPAAILTDLSSDALPMTDWSFCCYTPDVPANQKSWLRAQQRRQEQRVELRKRWAAPPRVKPRPETGKTKPARG